MYTEFDSMFHESGFIFVNERASKDRNGNKMQIGARTASEYKTLKDEYRSNNRNKIKPKFPSNYYNKRSDKGSDRFEAGEDALNNYSAKDLKRSGKVSSMHDADRNQKKYRAITADVNKNAKTIHHYGKHLEKKAKNESSELFDEVFGESVEMI